MRCTRQVLRSSRITNRCNALIVNCQDERLEYSHQDIVVELQTSPKPSHPKPKKKTKKKTKAVDADIIPFRMSNKSRQINMLGPKNNNATKY